jgi:hypothetical protein
MKKVEINQPWHLILVATLLFCSFGAVLHIGLLLLQALILGQPFPLGLISILGLQFFFPSLKSGIFESLLSFVAYTVLIALLYRFLKSLHITIEKK